MRACLTALALAGLLPAAALAQPRPQAFCAAHAALTRMLAQRFDEHRIGGGLQNATTMVELYAAAGGSWTLVLTRPDGTACAVAAGQNWQAEALPVGEPS